MYKHPQCWQYIWTLIIPPPPSPAATTVMNKRYPALQTVISAMLLDSTYHVLTEIGGCLSIPLALGSEPVWVSDTPFFTITSCNSQSVARVVSCHIHFTFISFSLPSLTCRHTHSHTRVETWGAPWFAWVCMSGIPSVRCGCRFVGSQLLSWDLYVMWAENGCPQFDSLPLLSAWTNLHLDHMHQTVWHLLSREKLILPNQQVCGFFSVCMCTFHPCLQYGTCCWCMSSPCRRAVHPGVYNAHTTVLSLCGAANIYVGRVNQISDFLNQTIEKIGCVGVRSCSLHLLLYEHS